MGWGIFLIVIGVAQAVLGLAAGGSMAEKGLFKGLLFGGLGIALVLFMLKQRHDDGAVVDEVIAKMVTEKEQAAKERGSASQTAAVQSPEQKEQGGMDGPKHRSGTD